MSLLHSIREQIFRLDQQRFPRSHMRLRATREGWNNVLKESIPDGARVILSEGPSLELVPVEFIDGILPTAYVWAPYRDFQFEALPDSRFTLLRIFEADRRLLDENILPVLNGPSIPFFPEQVDPARTKGRVNISSSVKRKPK